MSVLAATVVLAWGCLAILAMAMAGMLRQVRELQTEVAALRAEQGTRPWRAAEGRRLPELAGEGPAILLVLDPGCGLCDALHEPFNRLPGEHPGIRFEVLAPFAPGPRAQRHRAQRPGAQWSWADTPGIRCRIDPRLVRELDLPWAPALVRVSEDGMVFAGQPVSSPELIGAQVAGLVAPATSR